MFQKRGRQKQLTESGHQLLRHARQILALSDEALGTLRDSRLNGVLCVGSAHDIADTILPPLLGHIARAAPGLRLEIDVDRSPFLMEELHRGKSDMVISTREVPDPQDFTLCTSPVWRICSAQYIHTPSKPLPLVRIVEPSG